MAWNNPTTRAAGYVVPHTVWNSDVVDNPTALRGGALAISGQAAEALVKASSASQLALVTVPSRGAVLYAGASGAPGWLAAGTSGYVLTAAGAGADPAWALPAQILDRDVSATEVVNTVTETTVYTYSVAGGSLSTNRMIRGRLIGALKSDAARTITIKLKYGATTVATHAVSLGVVNAYSPAFFSFWISALNTTNAQVAEALSSLTNVNATVDGTGIGIGSTGATKMHSVHGTVAEDSTAAKTLAITVTHSNANANLGFYAYVTQVELL